MCLSRPKQRYRGNRTFFCYVFASSPERKKFEALSKFPSSKMNLPNVIHCKTTALQNDSSFEQLGWFVRKPYFLEIFDFEQEVWFMTHSSWHKISWTGIQANIFLEVTWKTNIRETNAHYGYHNSMIRFLFAEINDLVVTSFDITNMKFVEIFTYHKWNDVSDNP